MDAKLIFGLVVGVILLALLAALIRSRRGDGRMLTGGGTLPHMNSSFGDMHPRIGVALGRELLGLLESGEKAQAARLVRERAGLDAAEAEALIERLDGLRKRLES
jgi:tetrahydromethanopterin S-methyltransferase subunit G